MADYDWQGFISFLSRGGFGYYWIKHPDGRKQTIWFEGRPPELPDGSYDAYFGVNPSKARRGGAARARNEDIAAINCFFSEFDAKDHPDGKPGLLQLITQLALQPSVIVDSGGGYHCYWLLNDPRPLDELKERAYMADIQARWVEYVGGDPDARDLARVLRVPGTYNYKYDPVREVTFLRCDLDSIYYLEDFQALLPKPRPVVASPVPQGGQALEPNLQRWLQLAISRGGGRNDGGFWLAAQLRDDGIAQAVAEGVMRQYQAQVTSASRPYTLKEALDTLKSAYRSPAREPARNLAKPAVPARSNGNGHHPEPDMPEEPPMPEEWSTIPPDHRSDPIAENSEPVGNADPIAETGDAEAQDPGIIYLPTDEIREGLNLQETGDADLLVRLYAGKIVFDHAAAKWYLWRVHYWEEDRTGYVYQLLARRVAPQYIHAAAECSAKGLDDLAKELIKRAAALRNKKRMDNVLYLAARNPKIALTGEEWDANPWVLGCPNGVLELKTGNIRPGKPDDYIRSHCKTEWRGPLEKAPNWMAFMLAVMAGQIDMVCYLQRLFGYGITGLAVEHVFPILWGADGANGKGTMLQTLMDVLGRTIASPTDADALMASNRGNAAQPFLHDLRGMRLVWASETERGARIDESLIKRLTGGDTIKARTLYSQPIQFEPTHLILMLTNHRPHINASSPAIWRRVKLVEFSQRFVSSPQAANEHPVDLHLREKLAAEAPGILAWLVQGCLEWQEVGLMPPESVVNATSAYREEEDILGMFVSERCEVGRGEMIKASQLYAAYSAWCKESGFMALSLSTFGQEMHKKFERKRTMKGWFYDGVALRDVTQAETQIPF